MGGVNGRGREGTTAAAHAENDLVFADPPYPRQRIKEAINDTIKGLYPHLVVFDSTEITKNAVVYEYEMPSASRDVWYVTAKTIGPTKVWYPVVNWRFNPKANTTDFASGRSIQVFDFVTAGQSIRVVYAKGPTALSAGGDDFETVTGYADRIVDLVVYGALKRLLPAYESARLQQQAVEATERAQLVPPNSAAKAVQLYASLYAERLEEERALMFSEVANFQTWQG